MGDIVAVESHYRSGGRWPETLATINTNGAVTLWQGRDFTIAGKTPAEAFQEISKSSPDWIVVDSVQKWPEAYFWVELPGKGRMAFRWEKGITVLRALGMAGGYTDWRPARTVKLDRSNGVTYTVNLEEALHNPAYDLPVYPNDRIYWERKGVFGF